VSIDGLYGQLCVTVFARWRRRQRRNNGILVRVRWISLLSMFFLHLWFLVLGSWFLVLGSWFLVLGSLVHALVRIGFVAVVMVVILKAVLTGGLPGVLTRSSFSRRMACFSHGPMQKPWRSGRGFCNHLVRTAFCLLVGWDG